jgi:hypothetical protein
MSEPRCGWQLHIMESHLMESHLMEYYELNARDPLGISPAPIGLILYQSVPWKSRGTPVSAIHSNTVPLNFSFLFFFPEKRTIMYLLEQSINNNLIMWFHRMSIGSRQFVSEFNLCDSLGVSAESVNHVGECQFSECMSFVVADIFHMFVADILHMFCMCVYICSPNK